MRWIVLGAALTAAALTAAAHVVDRPVSTWKRIRGEGVVRVGYAPEAPFAFRTAEGRVTGEAPEIARVIFERLGIERIEWVQTEFRALIPELRAGRFDVVAMGMTINEARRREVDFSPPTFMSGAALLVHADSVAALCGFDSLRTHAGARVAVIEGAVEARLATAAGIPEARILHVPDFTTALEALRSGDAHAVALTQVSLRRVAHADSTLAVAYPVCDRDPSRRAVQGGGFAFRKDSPELRRHFGEELLRFRGTPAHLRLVEPFGFTPADLPAGPAR